MTTPELTYLKMDDFPAAVPQEDNAPVEWPEADIAKLASLPPAEFQEHLVAMLRWYVKEDDVSLGMAGNEYWEAGYHLAQALLAAQTLRSQTPPDAPGTAR